MELKNKQWPQEVIKAREEDREELYEAISEVILQEMLTDDSQTPAETGKQVVDALANNSAEGLFLALTGWTPDTAIRMARDRLND